MSIPFGGIAFYFVKKVEYKNRNNTLTNSCSINLFNRFTMPYFFIFFMLMKYHVKAFFKFRNDIYNTHHLTASQPLQSFFQAA